MDLNKLYLISTKNLCCEELFILFFCFIFFVFPPFLFTNTNVTIDAGAYYFNPDPIEIEVGSTVTWMNVGGLHDVNGVTNTITGESFETPEDFYLSPVYAMNADNPVEIGSYTFNVPGTYNYDCSIGNHAAQGMVGQILVTYVSYPGCTNELACNYDINANEDDGSCIINEVCCAALTPSCLACVKHVYLLNNGVQIKVGLILDVMNMKF